MALLKDWHHTTEYVANLYKQNKQLERIIVAIKEHQDVDPRFSNHVCPDCDSKGFFQIVHEDKYGVNSVKCVICTNVYQLCMQLGCHAILCDDNTNVSSEICDDCAEKAKADDWEPEEEPALPGFIPY